MNRKNPLFSADMDRESHAFGPVGPTQPYGMEGNGDTRGNSANPEREHIPGEAANPFFDYSGEPSSKDVGVGDKDKKEVVRNRSKNKVGDVVVKKGPTASGEMNMSIYSKIVASLKRLATEEEAPPATEEATKPYTEPEQTEPEEIPEGAGEALAMERARKDQEAQRKVFNQRLRELKQALESIAPEGAVIPEEAQEIRLQPGDPEYEEAIKSQEMELGAVWNMLQAFKENVSAHNEWISVKAKVAADIADARKQAAQAKTARDIFMRATGIKEKLKVVLTSADAVNHGIKSVKIAGGQGKAMIQNKRERGTGPQPTSVYVDAATRAMEISKELLELEQKSASPDISADDLAANNARLQELMDEFNKLEVTRGRTGPGKSLEMLRADPSAIERISQFMSMLVSRTVDTLNRIAESAKPLNTLPMAHPRTAEFYKEIAEIDKAIEATRGSFHTLSMEKQFLGAAEVEEMSRRMQNTVTRWNALKALGAGASAEDVKQIQKETGFRLGETIRKALRESSTAAELTMQLDALEQRMDMLERALLPEAETLEWLDGLSSIMDTTIEFYNSVAAGFEEAAAVISQGDVAQLESIIDMKPSEGDPSLYEAASASSRDRIMERLLRHAADEETPRFRGLRDYWEKLRSIVPGQKPSDVKKVERVLSPEDYAKEKKIIEREIDKTKKEKKKQDSKAFNPAELDAKLRQALKELSGLDTSEEEGALQLTALAKELAKIVSEKKKEREQFYGASEAKEKVTQTETALSAAWIQLSAASENTTQIAMKAAQNRGMENIKSLWLILDDVYGNLVNVSNQQRMALVSKSVKSFFQYRTINAVLNNMSQFIKGKGELGGAAIEAEVGMPMESRLISQNGIKGTVEEFYKWLSELSRLEGEVKQEVTLIQTMPSRTKEGVPTSSVDPKYKEKAQEMAESAGEQPAAEGEATASKSNGLDRKAQADAIGQLTKFYETMASYLQSFDAQVTEMSNFYIENRQGLEELNGLLSQVASGEAEAAPEEGAWMPGLEEAVVAAREDEMKRTAGDYDEFDKGNRLEIVESDGKRKLHLRVINDDLKEKVTSRVKDSIHGSFKCGDTVQVDFDDYLGIGMVKAYIGSGVYRVEVDGAVMEVPANRVLGLDNNPWR